jgi:hypothetical protein
VLHRLQTALGQARAGALQVVFVTGEPGIGKTSVIEAFLAQAAQDPHLWIAQGQCIEHYGVGEAYLPVLEALGGLCKEPGGQELIGLLVRQAPTWVVQMPWLIPGADLEALQRGVIGATQERMLRELGEAIAAITAERPLSAASRGACHPPLCQPGGYWPSYQGVGVACNPAGHS